ncbi:LuxR family transcriptional regulator [Kribbella jejuensis]|uniref:Regulatory LuxR family protein n=1 Tax=Kribbella jejuensis TaxID=236068 RepID=A0A542EW70_9ACTN|nr:LuxR C-terminal-related transcriptional regulator [Kribbella jejuensis]TQJ19605.1 regulatory LuxR family protein [Kribbella jejuensis]
MQELLELGLVEQDGDNVVLRPPRLAMGALAERYSQQAEVARESADAYSELWKAAAGRQDYVEVLPTYAASQAVLNSVQKDAREQVRAMTVGNLAARELRIVDGMFEALGRGVRYDVIYGAHVLQDANALHMVQSCIEAGEQARVFPHVPLNITIVDDRWALVGARAEVRRGPEFVALVVHDSPLLGGLERIFEALWRIAVPITGGTELNDVTAGPSLEAKRLLTYLSAGLTDESIAREFGVSERTVARRIGRLQEALGAQTRFQLGVQASRQGWL